MRSTGTAAALALAAALAVGCAPVDPDTTNYGVAQRVGVAAPTYVPLMGEASSPFNGQLGFTPSQGVEICYALPIRESCYVKFSLDFSSG